MPLDHYLPATFLASFSLDIKKPRRKSFISAIDQLTGKEIFAPASKLARIKNLYGINTNSEQGQRLVDAVWIDYEAKLASAIDDLIYGSITSEKWLRTLVPFVACLFIRGPDFNIRFDQRIREISSIEQPKGYTNSARIFELQRLLGPVLASDWIVAKAVGEGLLITNDLGYAPFIHGPTGQIGVSIPIGHKHILQLIPKRSRRILVLNSGVWIPKIKYASLISKNHIGLNESIAQIAQRYIFGPDLASLRKYFIPPYQPLSAPEPEYFGFISGPLAVVHEFTWHRLVSFLENFNAGEQNPSFDLDWPAIANGWAPPVYLPTNLPEFAPSLSWKANGISVSFFDVPGFTN